MKYWWSVENSVAWVSEYEIKLGNAGVNRYSQRRVDLVDWDQLSDMSGLRIDLV